VSGKTPAEYQKNCRKISVGSAYASDVNPLAQTNSRQKREIFQMNINTMIASTALAITLTVSATVSATASFACGGNACQPTTPPAGYTDYTSGGGFTTGGGEGFGRAMSNFDGNGNNVVEREEFAESMTGFNGSFRFARDACADCVKDTNAVFGEGFSIQRSGARIVTNGGGAFAGSQTHGFAGGEGSAWSR